jgi:hypothetical protein
MIDSFGRRFTSAESTATHLATHATHLATHATHARHVRQARTPGTYARHVDDFEVE